ncbi:hypothetical protein BaRGS_00029922 [Batillaria attramentaria]|uniref:Uncharacterized protein n=1 Tax=Batillaria attramentaria TaxID=370345 RepID=A0ABD0JVD6_9CAEN
MIFRLYVAATSSDWGKVVGTDAWEFINSSVLNIIRGQGQGDNSALAMVVHIHHQTQLNAASCTINTTLPKFSELGESLRVRYCVIFLPKPGHMQRNSFVEILWGSTKSTRRPPPTT